MKLDRDLKLCEEINLICVSEVKTLMAIGLVKMESATIHTMA